MTADQPADYALPSLWGDGTTTTLADWESRRRKELLRLFASHVYGHTPDGGRVNGVEVLSPRRDALHGLADRIELRVTVGGRLGTRSFTLLLHLPKSASPAQPVPVFLGLNFGGNHSTTTDGEVRVGDAPTAAAPSERGVEHRRWPYAAAVARGYAVATVHYGEIEPDIDGAAAAGVRGMFDEEDALTERRHPEGWGAVGAWAWGLSRALDALQTLDGVDGGSVIVHGHSRLGKAALWAAAQDPRFAAAISNDSGCAGASLFRHRTGEDVAAITSRFPHWFAPRLDDYRGREDSLPIDQHQLLALIAPRPLHVASASDDAWADPRGEYLSTLHASPVFETFGHRGTLPESVDAGHIDLPIAVASELASPPTGVRVGGRLSYHLRAGDHDVLAEDWEHFLDFADENLRGR